MDSLFELIQNFWRNIQNGQFPDFGYWNYVLLALLVTVEGPIVTLIGAAAAGAGLMRAPWVFIAAAAGSLTADFLWYSVGYLGRIEWLLHYGHWLGVRRRHLDRLRQSMRTHALKILLMGKFTHGLVIPSLIAAGLARVPFRRWFPVILVAEMLWTGVLVVVGYYATESIAKVERGVEVFVIVMSTLFVLFIGWSIWMWRRRKVLGEAFSDKD